MVESPDSVGVCIGFKFSTSLKWIQGKIASNRCMVMAVWRGLLVRSQNRGSMQLCSVGLREGVMRRPANATTCTEPPFPPVATSVKRGKDGIHRSHLHRTLRRGNRVSATRSFGPGALPLSARRSRSIWRSTQLAGVKTSRGNSSSR